MGVYQFTSALSRTFSPAVDMFLQQQQPSTSTAATVNSQGPTQIQLQVFSPHRHGHQNSSNSVIVINDGSNISSAGSSAGGPGTDHSECTPEKATGNGAGGAASNVATPTTTASFAFLMSGTPASLPAPNTPHSTTHNQRQASQGGTNADLSDQKKRRKRKNQQQEQNTSGSVFETPPKAKKTEKKINDYFMGKVRLFSN